MSDTAETVVETPVETPVVETPGAGEQNPVEPPTPEAPKGDFKVIDSQEDLDRIINQRLAREKSKYADYDDLKQKADQLAAIERDKMTAEEQLQAAHKEAQTEIESLKAELAKRDFEKLRSDVAAAKGVPPHLAARLRGESQEELESDADELLQAIQPKQIPNDLPSPTGGGKPPVPELKHFDPAKKAAELIGGGIPKIV